MLTIESVKQSCEVHTYIAWADEMLGSLGYTEHSFAHVTKVAHFARKLLLDLGYPERTAELAWIAGYLHDIGNVVNRYNHAQSGALMAFRVLDHLGAEPDEISAVISAIGNHDEGTAFPVTVFTIPIIVSTKTATPKTKEINPIRIHPMTGIHISTARRIANAIAPATSKMHRTIPWFTWNRVYGEFL